MVPNVLFKEKRLEHLIHRRWVSWSTHGTASEPASNKCPTCPSFSAKYRPTWTMAVQSKAPVGAARCASSMKRSAA